MPRFPRRFHTASRIVRLRRTATGCTRCILTSLAKIDHDTIARPEPRSHERNGHIAMAELLGGAIAFVHELHRDLRRLGVLIALIAIAAKRPTYMLPWASRLAVPAALAS